jgi:CARDB
MAPLSCFSHQMPDARKLLLAFAGAALLAAPGSALAAPTASAAAAQGVVKRPAVAATLQACVTTGAARKAVFKGAMPGIGSGRMEMRFDLYAKSADTPTWTPVDVDEFGQWDLSDPGVSGFIIKKRVSGMQAGVSYRSVVRFRWRNDGGRIVKTARKVTKPCVQPDTAPDLVARDPSIVAGVRDDVVVYHATITNVGLGAAGPFDVTLAVNGIIQPAQRLGPLVPGAATQVTFQAPRCQAGTIVRFTVDANAEIPESNESNNALERRCAAPK